MAVTITFTTIPIGSILTSTIASDEPESKNDFRVRIITSENGTGLTESDITFSTGASLVELTGDNAAREATIRPPTTAGTLTLTIGADAFTEGNAETSLDIRVSTSFPDTDAEDPTLLFDTGKSATQGIAVTPTRILISDTVSSDKVIHKFTHAGTEMTGERIETQTTIGVLDYLNGDILMRQRRYALEDFRQISSYPVGNAVVIATELGVTFFVSNTVTDTTDVYVYSWDSSVAPEDISISNNTLEHTDFLGRYQRVAEQGGLLYLQNIASTTIERGYGLAEITDRATINFIKRLNITINASTNTSSDLYAYQDTLYILNIDDEVRTLDIRKYRPLTKNTKTTIYPVFANEGATLPLLQLCPDAKEIVFGVGFDKPDYLSINADNEIAIASNAVTETQPVLVKLTGINYIDSIDFEFYLIIEQAANPTVRDITDLAMYASTTFNLFDVVDNATSITFRTGQTQPTGSSISSGIFTIGTVGGTAYFTATNSNGSTNFEIAIDVVSVDPDNFSDTFRYRTEIAGIDVSGDVKGTPIVSESIDEVRLNVVTANRVNLTLRSDSTNGFKFNGGLADNFWDANSLNADGFQEPVKVYIESLISGSYVRSLLFSGRIHEPAASISEAEVRISAVDISTRLRNTLVSDFGTLTKWDALKQQSDAVNYEGVNIPESSLLPIQLGTGTAWSDRTKLDISRLPLSSEGPAQSNTGYLTSQDFRTAGGFLASLPILRFKTEHRAEDVRFLIKQAAINKDIYQTQIDIPAIQRDTPFILNRGSVPFSIEDTRITRLPTDWVHDSTNDRLLIPLSNPESHIADVIVQYDLGSDAYRILHTFDKDISVHRIARRTSTDYYILSAKAISQDRSAAALPRAIDSTVFAYDSISEGSEIKILRYNASTDTLTEHVDEDDSHPPQLGIHYHVGFENDLYVDEFEGIVADYRGSFKFQGSNLYYRYATSSEFGVARVNTSGTTTEMIDQGTLNYQNHLNFAFDVTSGGDIYFVYSEAADAVLLYEAQSSSVSSVATTFTNDLSDISLPVRIRIEVKSVRVFAGDVLTMSGTDTDGNTITEDIDLSQHIGSGRSFTVFTTRAYATLTEFDSTDLDGLSTGSRLSLNAVPISSLWIKRRTSGGVETTRFTDTKALDALTALDDAGGAYLGCHEALFHDDNLYMLCPIGRVDSDGASPPVYTRSRENAAGMVLYSCDVTASTPSLTVIEKWDFVAHSACNLTIHDGNVHYVEQPIAASKFLPINSSL